MKFNQQEWSAACEEAFQTYNIYPVVLNWEVAMKELVKEVAQSGRDAGFKAVKNKDSPD